ncbi:MAG: SDR family oxidoreductase, partial [Nannocystaceae bacterium]
MRESDGLAAMPVIAVTGFHLPKGRPCARHGRVTQSAYPPSRQFGGKVLVTGSSGHLGANLVRRLLADGEQEVRVLVRAGSNNEAIEGLDYIEETPHGGLQIGAMTQLSTLRDSPLVHRHAPVLAHAAGL